MSDELVDIVNKHGAVLRQAMKSQAHTEGLLHKTTIGCMHDKDGWWFVSQAAHKQDAGQLVSPVGGHVQAGETNLDAIRRETLEEVGITDCSFHEVGRAVYRRTVLGRDENHLFIVYEITTSQPIIAGDEIASVERLSNAEHRRIAAEEPERFGDAHYFLLEKFFPDYLPKSWVRRWDA